MKGKKGDIMKKIYKLSQNINTDFDTYDSMVIIADTKKEAIPLSYEQSYMFKREILDKDLHYYTIMRTPFKDYRYLDKHSNSWAFEKDIIIEYLGKVGSHITDSKVVCASFNAG